MVNPPPTETDPRKLLFISYAYEDQVFAKWLARKLAFYGYGVWIDQIQILGGESWVKEVEVAIRVAQDRRGLKAYRAGTRPIVRGTLWKVSPRAAYLWASGFKPVLRTYDGWDVPEPLRIEIQHGEADIRQVAIDIFGLTKLNYNACKLGESQPVTVHFSDAVGEILVANQGTKTFLPNFKYYV